MIKINEWDRVGWDTPPKPPTELVDRISQRLSQLEEEPMAVHFYRGEGLRWIRVAFERLLPLTPSAVVEIGSAIQGCLAPPESLYFNGLRPHDLLFFLPGGDPDSVGMEPRYFGVPLEEVLETWP